ncbi:MAG: hypothetical protein ABIP21_01815, partial [Acidimicrobiia bacterium]
QLHLACSTGEIVHVHERVYRFAGAPVTWKTSLMAACWAGGIRAVASYRSAAALKALPAGSEICEITCPRWRRARHDGLIVHETRALHPMDVAVVDGIPTTTVARTLLDLAAIISPPDLERSLENALRRHLVSLDELDAMLHRLSRPGRTGLRSLRQLVQARMVPGFRPTESEAESLILQSIRRHGIVEPVRQFKVYNGSVRIGRVDLSYPDARIAIEYDSDEFHTGRVATAQDAARRHRLVCAGWLPLVASVSDLRNGGAHFCAALSAALRDRTLHPHSGVTNAA